MHLLKLQHRNKDFGYNLMEHLMNGGSQKEMHPFHMIMSYHS